MITSLFRKSTPLNYSLLIIAVIFFFFVYQINQQTENLSVEAIVEKGAILVIIFGTLFTINFIVKKNGLSKDSSYAILFYLLFLLFFPSVWGNLKLITANFLVLLALRRLLSMQSLKSQKEKIFDASFWIFAASLFYFWSILFVILVFIAILFHVAREFSSWFLPFIALFTVTTIFVFLSLVLKTEWISQLLENATVNYKFDYFKNNYENLSFSIFVTVALFFLFSLLVTLSGRPLILHSTYKKVLCAFFIGVAILVISPFKSNELLIFSFAPLAIMATSHIELPQQKLKQEIALFVLIACSLFAFFSQL